MTDQKNGFDEFMARLEAGQETKSKSEMSRGTQTAWIVGTLIVLGLGALYYVTRLPSSDPLSQCQLVIGMDEQCEAEVLIKILNGHPGF